MNRSRLVGVFLLAVSLGAAGCAATGKAVIAQYQEVTPTRFEGAVAVVLENRETARVNDDGEQLVLEGFKRIKLLDRKATDCSGDDPNCRLLRFVCYNETFDEVEKIEARTITPDGKVIEVDQDDMSDQTFTSWAIPDQDQRCWVWKMKGASPGAIFEERYRIRNKKILAPGSLWFQDRDPVLEASFSLSAPASYPYRWKVYNIDVQPTEKKEGERITRTWTARDISPLIPEDGMVAPDDLVAKLVLVSEDVSAFRQYKSCHSIKTWQDVGACWHEMIADKQEVTEVVKQTARRIAKTAKTETEKVRAVWDWMNQNVRYVGLERGLAGWIPLSAHVVCTKKYGDCKAVAGLISVLCRELGLKADPISIGTRPQLGQLDVDLPGFFYFNHSIARVEADGKVYWLDATHRDVSFDITTARNQGIHVVVSRPGSSFLDFIPAQPPETNLLSLKAVFVPLGDSEMQLQLTSSAIGNIAEWYRVQSHEYIGEKWQKWVEEFVAESYPQASVVEQSYTGKDDNNEPFSLKVVAKIPRALQPSGKGMSFEVKELFPSPAYGDEYLFDYFKLPKRFYPLDLYYKQTRKNRYEVQIPKGMKVAGLPKNVMFEDDFVKVERLSQIENGRVVAEYTLVVKVLLIPPDKYPEARKSFRRALDANSFVLIFEPVKGSS